MGSLPTESLSVEEHQQQQVEMDDTSRTERTGWLLNSPDPPSIWHELAGSIREAFVPRNKLSSSSRVKQTWRRSAFSFLRGLFPILNWGRNYKASKFKSDLMAGLTLASLSIPQVAEVSFPSGCFLIKVILPMTWWSNSRVSKTFCRVLDMPI